MSKLCEEIPRLHFLYAKVIPNFFCGLFFNLRQKKKSRRPYASGTKAAAEKRKAADLMLWALRLWQKEKATDIML